MLQIICGIRHVSFGFLMAIGHLQTIWKDRQDVPTTFVLRYEDGVRRYRLVKWAHSPEAIVEFPLARNPFIVTKLLRDALPLESHNS